MTTSNIYLVWLDENINENNDNYRKSIRQLREVINTMNTFANIDECIDFITDRPGDIVFMITSKTYVQRFLPVAIDLLQLKSIYILCQKGQIDTTWTNKCSKINYGFKDIKSICETLKQALKDDNDNEVSISFAKTTLETSNVNKDKLDCSFMYTQILKEILLTIDFNDEHFTSFLTFCRDELAGNAKELRNVDKIQNEYRTRTPIWWYTYESFLYTMINKALRLMDIDIIVKMGFFVRDLHKHITLLHVEQFNGHTSTDSFIVYRGQGLSRIDFNQMKENKNGLLAFNNFLSTSKDRQVSMEFIRRIATKSDLVPVLFIIHIDPSIKRTPFANVTNISAVKREEEILFSMHSVFRIGQMMKLDEDNRIWKVELILTSENDRDLHILTERIREETQGSTGWHRLGELLIRLAKFDKAEELYMLLLRKANDPSETEFFLHQLGYIYNDQAKFQEAIIYHQESLEISKKSLPADHPSLATSYSNIGSVLTLTLEYSKALEYYQKSLEISKKSLPSDHPNLATSYSNIGSVHNIMSEYSKALEYYKKSLDIRKKSLPADHPSLATSYNNIGSVYDNMSEYSKALEYYQKSLEISKKSLPTDHPDLAITYNNIGTVYYYKQDYTKALEYLERALNMWEKSLSENHPNVKTAKNSIAAVKKKLYMIF